jgi:hypothetical protein
MRTNVAFSKMPTYKTKRGLFSSLIILICLFLMPMTHAQGVEQFDSDLHDYLAPPKSPTVGKSMEPEAGVLDLFLNDRSSSTAVPAACTWSPNGFPIGQCTWYADGRVKDNGWLLSFSQNYGRDAYKWWYLVSNAYKGQEGHPGDIMVFAKSSSLPYGHVAYVESTQITGKKWTVLHANWSRGTVIGTLCGYNIRRVTVEKKSNGQVSVGGSSTTYSISGFIYQKNSGSPGAISVNPSSGNWTSSPQNLNITSSNATTIYYTMVNTYDGSNPKEPTEPSATNNSGRLSGNSGIFQFYASPGQLKKAKIRFRGYNGSGYGAASSSYSYALDLRSRPGESVYRFWSDSYKHHFYTISAAEKDSLRNNPNWSYDGIAWNAFSTAASGTTPVYRFWSNSYMGHFYTISADEKDSLRNNPNWSYEGIKYYVFPSAAPGAAPVYRFWSSSYMGHFYTISAAEKDSLRNNPNWSYEGIAWYAYAP